MKTVKLTWYYKFTTLVHNNDFKIAKKQFCEYEKCTSFHIHY